MRPLNTKRRFRRFAVYDLEWIPGSMQLRLAGLYDGDRFADYTRMEDFLRAVLLPSNSGCWYFAHYGGMADINFLLEALLTPAFERYSVSMATSGSAAVIVDVTLGDYTWRFADSFFLMRTSLAKIGAWIGSEKGGPAEDASQEEVKAWYATVPYAELCDYCEQDCRILFDALKRFELELWELGGQLKCTAASSALEVFQRAYLKEELPVNVAINGWARQSYIASRVEVLESKPLAVDYYDINSSFPAAMTRLLPGRLRRVRTDGRLPVSGPYLADATVRVPETFLPPIPLRQAGRVFFPHGSWRSYFTWVDLQLLEEQGGQILSVGDVIEFDPLHDLAAFAEDIYAKRGKARDKMQGETYKIVGNAFYGKMAEREIKEQIWIRPPPEVLTRLRGASGLNQAHMLRPGVWAESLEVPVMHQHVVISSAITAHAREALYQHMMKARRVYYCDTDGFGVSPDSEYALGDKLGDLKREKQWDRNVWFVAPKVYRGGNAEGVTHKAKGFSLGKTCKAQCGSCARCRVVAERWESVANGREIEIEKMRRVREGLVSDGEFKPVEILTTKALRNPFPKRHFYRDGTSRPWHTSELPE